MEDLFLLLVSYTTSREEREGLLPAHHAYLQEHFEAGRFLASGPLDPSDLGADALILAKGSSFEQIRQTVDEDPFARAGFVKYRIVRVAVNRSASAPLPVE